MLEFSLRQIRYFLALSKTLQYQRAARHLQISQPSLSLQIKAFEDAVGGKLVERRRTGLILTPLGREVALKAEEIMRNVEALKSVGTPLGSDLTGTLRLGSSPTVGPYLLPKVLQRLHVQYPELKLVIRDGPPRDLVEGLGGGKHDMILTQLPVPDDDLRVRPLFREPLFLAVARDHPLATASRATHADLAGESLLSLSPAYALHKQLAALAENAGGILREDFEGTSLDALRQMVSLGMGVTLLPALYVRSEVAQRDPDVAIVPFHPKPHRQLGMVWRASSGNPAAFTQFGNMIRIVVQDAFADVVSVTA